MKKLLLSIIAVATVATASAQEFSWGIKAGVNFASMYGSDVKNASIKTDFVGGVFGEFKTNDWFGISAEILYAGQGAKNSDINATLNTSNLNIPIMANFHVSKVVSLGTGIQPGFLLGAKAKGNGESMDVKSQLNTFDLAIPVNVRFQLNCGLMFDVRYNIGVTKVFKDKSKGYNDGFAITAGWRF